MLDVNVDATIAAGFCVNSMMQILGDFHLLRNVACTHPQRAFPMHACTSSYLNLDEL